MRRMGWAVILTMCILVGIGLYYRVPSTLTPTPQAPRADHLRSDSTSKGPQSELRGAVLVAQTATNPDWKVMADQAVLYDKTQTAIAQGVRAQLFEDRETVLSLQADEGRVSQANGDISVQGHVNVEHRDGYTIRTDALGWQASSHTLQTDKPVEIEGPSMQITGTGLRGEVDDHQFSLQRNVKASFQLPIGDPHPRRTQVDDQS